jgi:hypothetical protein
MPTDSWSNSIRILVREKIVIEKVSVNPKLDVSLFLKPQIETAMNRR